MLLTNIKRTEKRGNQYVMEDKFALLFQTSFNVGEGDLVFSVWSISSPIVVIVHGNQESQSWATITWDNAYADATRMPFQVPESMKWSKLSRALNSRFTKNTEKSLSPENLHYLCEYPINHLIFFYSIIS